MLHHNCITSFRLANIISITSLPLEYICIIITFILLDKLLDCKLGYLDFVTHHFRVLSSGIKLSMWQYMFHIYSNLTKSRPISADRYFIYKTIW